MSNFDEHGFREMHLKNISYFTDVHVASSEYMSQAKMTQLS